MKLKSALCLLAALCIAARSYHGIKPTLITSCVMCDSSIQTDWGDGTTRNVIGITGTGYRPNEVVVISWIVNEDDIWSFSCLTDNTGVFTEVWTDIPVGVYLVVAEQEKNKNKSVVVASANVTVF